MHRVLAISGILVAMLTAGCGGSTSSTSTSAPTSRHGSYRQQVSDCLRNVGYQTRDAGNALRVQRPTGDLIANIQTFPSAKAAARFARGLVGDGRAGGRGVAVFLRDADGAAKRVVAGCLTP
jgi:hypothetical protein